MADMAKTERIKKALAKEKVDRVPLSIWFHMPDVDQDPVELAERSIAVAHHYDFDFIKMMPFGNYGAHDYGLSVRFFCTETQPALEREFAIKSHKDWLQLEPLPAYYGTYGKQVQFAQQLQKLLKGEDLPYIQTIFSPLTTAFKLAGKRIFTDLRGHPSEVHHALKVIAETTCNFCKANIEAGVAGFFFASKCSSYNFMTDVEYAEFGVPYDMQVLNSYIHDTYFNVVHIHGDNTMFEKLANYPVNCVNWHDRWVSPTMAEARNVTDKCLLGGINEKRLKEELFGQSLVDHIEGAIRNGGVRGLMLGPGCVATLPVDGNKFATIREAVNTLSKKYCV